MQKLKIKMALVFQTTLLLCFQRKNMDYHVLYTALSPFYTRYRANLFAQCETKTKISLSTSWNAKPKYRIYTKLTNQVALPPILKKTQSQTMYIQEHLYLIQHLQHYRSEHLSIISTCTFSNSDNSQDRVRMY